MIYKTGGVAAKQKGYDLMKTGKRISAALMAAILSIGALCSCGTPKDDGRVKLEVGDWVKKTATDEDKKIWADKLERFKKQYPDIDVIEGNTYQYDVKTFNARAAAGQLPTFLEIVYTEIPIIRSGGYAADITKALKNNDLLDKINPEMLAIITDEDGKICGLPKYAYAQGLVINKKLFKEAGLVDESGKPKVPQTWEELGEYSKIIREKTGTAGFVMPTTDNCGGWIFMNMAWSYGTNFEELQKDGKWKAVFDSPECREALKYVYDLRWKYNALPDDKVLNYEGYIKTFGSGQAAMTIADPGQVTPFVQKYGMDKDDIYFAKLPAGPKGRYVQMGGGIKAFFSKNTDEQNDAGVKWLMMDGVTPYITPDVEQNIRNTCQQTIDNGGVVFPKELFSMWQSDERDEKIEQIYADYANVDMSNYEEYMDFTGVILRPEETACCQQLYSVLDGAIQEILTNQNADIDALVKTAVSDFQQNHLDKME